MESQGRYDMYDDSKNVAQAFQEFANLADEMMLNRTLLYTDIAYGMIEALVAMDGRENWNQFLREALDEVTNKEELHFPTQKKA